jgi:hypothetical protein
VFGVCLFFLGRKLKKVDKKGLVPLGWSVFVVVCVCVFMWLYACVYKQTHT